MKQFAVLFTLLISVISLSAQTSRTWTGSTSTDWNTASNWSPSGVPSSTDHIVLNNGSLTNMPLLNANQSIANITVSAGILNLNGDTLTVTGTTTLTGGQINNGVIKFNNSTTSANGITFGAKVIAVANDIGFVNTIFSNTLSATKSAGTHNYWNNNSYGGDVEVKNNSTAGARLYLNGNNNITYNGDLTLSGAGQLYFTNGTGTSTFATGKKIKIGTSGATYINIDRAIQTDTLTQSITLSGTNSQLNINNSQFTCRVVITSTYVGIGNSTFNSDLTATKTGGWLDYWNGNTYNSTVHVNNNSTVGIYLSGNTNVTYNDDLTLGGSGQVYTTSGTGNTYFSTGKKIRIASGGLSGQLYLVKVVQTDTVTQSLSMTGNLTLNSCTWSCPVNMTSGYISVGGSTFNNVAKFCKTGGFREYWDNNTFNYDLTVKNTAASTILALTDGNNSYFNGNVYVNNTSTGELQLSHGTGSAIFANNKKILIGTDGGFTAGRLSIYRVVQTDTLTQTINLPSIDVFVKNSSFSCPVNINAQDLLASTNTFNAPTTLVKNSGWYQYWSGNTFNSTANIKCFAGSGVSLYLTDNANAYYNGNLYLSTGSTNSVIYLTNGTGTTYLASGKTISVGSDGCSNGQLRLVRLSQAGATAQSLTLTGSATLYINTGSTFNGNLTVSSPNVFIEGTTFNGTLAVTKTSSSTNTWSTANTYNGDVSITNTGSGYINTSYVASGGDTYNANATFTKSGTGDVIIAGNASTVTFKGNVTLNNISSTQFTGSQVALFTGTNSQTLTQSGSSLNFGKLTINKASNNLTLSSPLTVSTALTLTSGKILTTSTNLLNLADNATVSSASNSSYVQGPMSKTGNDAFTFPTGKTGYYRPIGITAPSSTATVFIAEYTDAAQTLGTTADTSIANLSTCEYWALTRSGSTSNVNVTLGWNAASCNGAVANNMRVVGWNGSQWTNYGNGSRTGNATVGTVTSNTNPTAYNAFALSNKNCTGVATITPSGATSFCSGGSVTLTAPAGAKKYSWLPSGGLQSITASLSNSYIVKVVDTLGCTGKDTVDVTVWANPTINAGVDTVIVAGDTIQLNATAGSGTSPYSYLWTPSTGLSSTTVANPFAHPDTLTNYIVRVADAHGCINRDTMKVWAGVLSFTMSEDTVNVRDTIIFTNTSTGFPLGQLFNWWFSDECASTIYAYSDSCYFQHTISTPAYYKKYAYTNRFYPKLNLVLGAQNVQSVIASIQVINSCDGPPLQTCNLISNPSFDEGIGTYTIIPVDLGFPLFERGQVSNACPWLPRFTVYDAAIDSMVIGTPDLFSPFAPFTTSTSDVRVPHNFVGDQYPYINPNYPSLNTGYIGLYTLGLSSHTPGFYNYREYAQQKLINPLISGSTYYVSYRVSKGDNSLADTNVDAILTDSADFGNQVTWIIRDVLPDVQSGIVNSSGGANDSAWVWVGDFVSGANQKYITIGRFNDQSNSNVDFYIDTLVSTVYSYYYIDWVQIIPINLHISSKTKDCKRRLTPSLLCESGLEGYTFANIHWTGPGLMSNDTLAIVYADLNAGTYIFNADLIINKDTIAVSDTIVLPSIGFGSLGLSAGASPYICGSSISAISANASGGVPPLYYNWTTTDTSAIIIDPYAANTQVTVTHQTEFIITVTDTCGNAITDTVIVDYFPCCEGDIGTTYNGTNNNASDWGTSLIGGLGTFTSDPNLFGSACNGVFAINGTFYIDQDFLFKDICVVLGKDAMIIVKAGNTLTINHSHLYACTEMWGSIYIEPTAHLDIYKNSLVEDAQAAVVSPAQATYDITETVFNKNYTSINVMHWGTSNYPGNITTCKFLCYESSGLYTGPLVSTLLLPPYSNDRSFIGITSFAVNNFEVGGITSIEGNTFDNLYLGMANYASNILVQNNTFNNMQMPPWWGTTSIPTWATGYSADYFGKGIYSENYITASGRTATINRNNTFSNSIMGIDIFKHQTVRIDDNNFNNLDLYGVLMRNSIIKGHGLAVTNNVFSDANTAVLSQNNKAAHININQNTIGFPYTGANINLGIGVLAFEFTPAKSTIVKIDENTITDTKLGIWAYNLSSPFFGTAQSHINNNIVSVYPTPTNYAATGIGVYNSFLTGVMFNHIYGPDRAYYRNGIKVGTGVGNFLYCNFIENIGRSIFAENGVNPTFLMVNKMTDAYDGLYCNYSTVGNIGSNLYEWKNRWFGTFDHFYSYNNNIPINPNKLYTIATTLPFRPTLTSQIYSSSGILGMYSVDSAINQPSYPDSCGGIPYFIEDEDVATGFLNALTDTTTLADEVAWLQDYNIYTHLSNDSNMLGSDTAFVNFYNANRNGNIGQIQRIIQAFEYPDSLLDITTANLFLDTLTMLSPVNAPEHNLKRVLQVYLTKQTDTLKVLPVIWQSIEDLMGKLVPRFNDTLPRDIDVNFNTAQIQVLDSIARLCPYTDGPGVYMARASLRDSAFYTFTNSCEDSVHSMARTAHIDNAENKQVKVYPNPTNGNVFIELQNISNYCTLQVINSSGKTIKSIKLTDLLTEINLGDKPNGLYFIRIFDCTGKVIESKKLSLIR